MTPLKQQISLIPFSIEHTGIVLTSDGVVVVVVVVVVIVVVVVVYSSSRECKPPPTLKFETKVTRESGSPPKVNHF